MYKIYYIFQNLLFYKNHDWNDIYYFYHNLKFICFIKIHNNHFYQYYITLYNIVHKLYKINIRFYLPILIIQNAKNTFAYILTWVLMSIDLYILWFLTNSIKNIRHISKLQYT